MTVTSNYATTVQELYVAYFGRPADPTGLQNFETALEAAGAPTTLVGLNAAYNTSPAVAALINSFGTSTESGNLYGTNIATSSGATQQFVLSVFQSLFNRAPLTAGLDFWANAIVTGVLTPGAAALSIAAAAAPADTATLGAKVSAAIAFTTDLGVSGTTADYKGAAAAAFTRTFLLSINSATPTATIAVNALAATNSLPTPTPTPAPAPTPTPTPAPVPTLTPTLALTVSGDTVNLSGTTAASTVSLTGADLAAYSSGTYGTVAKLLAASTTAVTDSGGNFTLNADGNAHATTFNFGTGVVSGLDAASSAGITYQGVTTYEASAGGGDTVTLSAVSQNVIGNLGNNTVALGSLAYIGTVTFGASGSDTIQVSGSSNISGGTITTGGATVALVLSGAGTETLSTAEYNLFNATSITGGSFGGDTVTFSNAGVVTANANVGNYDLSTAGNTITLTNILDNVTGAASGSDTVNLAALTYAGTVAFGASGSDAIHVTVGGNISLGTITTGGATVALVLSGAGTETLNTAEYNLFNATSITGGSFGGDTVTFSNAGSVTANANVGNYDLSTAGNTITLTNALDNVTGAASGSDTVNLAALSYTGTVAFGASGSDAIQVSGSSNISGGTINTGGATVALVLSGAGTETLSTAEYNLFNATSITGGSFGGDTLTFSNAGVVTANANVGNYDLSTAGNTITLTNVLDNVTGAASGSDTVNLAALTYAGTMAFGASGSDAIHVTVGSDISGGTITTGGATVALVLSGAGTETLSTAEYNLFNATSITGGSFGGDTVVFSNAGVVTANANVGNYDLSTAGNTIALTNILDNVTGAASGSDTVNLAALSYTGTVAFGASGSDAIHVTVGGNISLGTITTGGATVALVLSGAGTETLSTAEYNLFNATSITGGTFGTDTITLSNAGTATDNANVGHYDLSTAGNTITLTQATADVTGAASGNDIVAIPQFSFAGTLAFGGIGTDIVQDPTNGDFSGLTVTSSGATLELMITGVASGVPSGSTTTTEVYNEFTTGPHAGGIVFPGGGDTNPADYIMAFSDQGTVTDSANISNYNLNASAHSTINDIYTFTVANNSADNISEYSAATGGSTYNINVSTFTGSISLGSSGIDTISVAAGNDISGGHITSSGTALALSITGSGTVTVSSAEAALFHAAPLAIAAAGTDTMNIADATSAINLNAQENALTTVGIQAGSNTVNVSVGAASVNAGAAGFNQTISENGTGSNTFNIDNGAATITAASDASHYVTINNFNTASDNVALTLSGVAQNAGEQDISDSGNDTITVANNGVIVLTDLGALPGFTLFDATDLASAAANLLRAVNASTATTGEYTFVVDTNQGAGIYETHINSGSSSIDGIQLIGVIHGVGAFNLVGHVA
jgi:hypothetical protein